jgi:phenylpropionate dioxygenase-like ring-hydroxylating dioxygenase large terminal subunit
MTIQRILESDFTKTPVNRPPVPELGHAIIPKERYTSPEFMKQEWEKMWKKVWLLGCRDLDIPEAGDYCVTEIGRQSVLLVRQKDGKVKAFHNACQHRGNQLRPRGLGHVDETFKCIFHLWEYELDGNFRNIPDLETFPQGAPCRGLMELPCDTWGSFVWYSLDQNPGPLRDYLGPIPEHLDPYHFERMVMVRDWTIEWDANWKTGADAFNESYHVQGTHPQLMYYLDDINLQIDCFEKHSRYLVPFAAQSPRVPETTEIPPLIKLIMKEAGMSPAKFEGSVHDVRKAVQRHKREHGHEEGLDYSELNDDQLTDDYHYFIFPNISLNVHADDLMLFRFRPHPTDPDKMFFDMQNFRLLKHGEEPPRRRVPHKQYKHGDVSLTLVVDQDAANMPTVQRGMHSDGFSGLWLSNQEIRIRHFHKVIDEYLNG